FSRVIMEGLYALVQECLSASEPHRKLELTQRLQRLWRAGRISRSATAPPPIPAEEVVGRPPRPRLVPPRQLPRRSLGSANGRAALLHAVAHIEFNAINLAWDAVYRFRDMPQAYYDDWIDIAVDEARHFSLVCARLAREGVSYWDFEAHGGLWTMAGKT